MFTENNTIVIYPNKFVETIAKLATPTITINAKDFNNSYVINEVINTHLNNAINLAKDNELIKDTDIDIYKNDALKLLKKRIVIK